MLHDDCFHLDYVHTRRRDRKLLWRRKLLCNELLVDADHYQLLKRTRIVAVQLTVNVERVIARTGRERVQQLIGSLHQERARAGETSSAVSSSYLRRTVDQKRVGDHCRGLDLVTGHWLRAPG